MTPKQAEELWEKQKINVFDLTHVWPKKQFRRREVGIFTLNENAQNYFAEIEQVAFNPAHLVPGIEPSADPVLQSRLFSYPDAHCHRVGVNYQQLPVNSPRTPYHMANFQRDGSMAFYNQGARPNYISSIEPIGFRNRTVDLDKTQGHFTGEAITFLSEIRPENFNAPSALWERVWDKGTKERFIENVSGHISNCSDKEIIKRHIGIFREVSDDIATRLEKAAGVMGYDGISTLRFNGAHNGMAKDKKLRNANGMSGKVSFSETDNNGAPIKGTHKMGVLNSEHGSGVNGRAANGVNGHANGVKA